MNPYDVLNVRKNASNSEIKLSFNRLMEKYDLKNYLGDPHFAKKRMAEIAEAYNILSDTQKRKAYDDSHATHINLHQKEKINSDDVFTPYYKRQKTTEHIHNDFEIAQNKYNKSKYNSEDPIQDLVSEDLSDETTSEVKAVFEDPVILILLIFFIFVAIALAPKIVEMIILL